MQGQRTFNSTSNGLLQRLQHFQSIFTAADASGDGSLDQEEFLEAFRSHLGNDDKALRRMFHAIDANCDGSVNWEEFSAYLLLEKTAAVVADDQTPGSSRKTASTFHELHATSGTSAAAAVSNASAGHQAPISCLVHADVTGAPDRWYSAGSDGVVQVWNGKDLSHMRTYQSGLSTITSATYLPSSSLLALGSYSRSLLLMDPSTGRQAGFLQNVASTAALSITAWPAPAAAAGPGTGGVLGMTVQGLGTAAAGMVDGSSTSRSVVEVCRDYMAIGDAGGSVRLLLLDLDDTADKKTAERFTIKKLWQSSNHRDWVTSVLHCPQISSVAAASLDKTVSLTDLERCIAVRTLAGHSKAVHCCAWNSLLKVVASGSADRKVLLWNPFSCRTLGTLEGHSAAVVCLSSNERDMQLITAAADNTIKVWDLRNQRCLQTLQLNPRASALGGHQLPLSVLAFSPQSQSRPGDQRLLIAGAVRLQGWALSDAGVSVRVGHREPVSWAGCVDHLQEVVSTDHGGTVCCWDLMTGDLLHSFSNTHGSCRISTAALDGDCKRLITGAEDGSINVWNFRSGRLLSTVSRPATDSPGSQWGSGSGVEVTGLAVAASTDTNGQAAPSIVATGWDRKVTWYADTGKRRCTLLRSFAGADSDVLAAAAMPGCSILATACHNGEVYLWNLDSGAIMRKLVPMGLQARPPTERSVEALAFMHDDLKHILVAVGADRMLLFWDSHSGNCIEHDTSDITAHGEAICAVAVSPDNAVVVTADTTGRVNLWDVQNVHISLHSLAAPGPGLQRGMRPGSALNSPTRAAAAGLYGQGCGGLDGASANRNFHSGRPQSAGSPRPVSRTSGVFGVAAAGAQQARGVRRVAGWRAHTDAVTALLWVQVSDPAPKSAAAAAAGDADQAPAQGVLTEQPSPAAAAIGQELLGEPSIQSELQQRQQQEPRSRVLEAAEGQQQVQQLLAGLQQQQQVQQQRQQQRQQPQQEDEKPPDPRQQQLAAAIQGMHAAAAAVHSAATDSAAKHGTSSKGFILSAALDRSMVLWGSTGAKVGAFSSRTWDLNIPSTWQDPQRNAEVGPSNVPDATVPERAWPPETLPSQHSLGSTCSSSDVSQVSVSAREDTAAAAAAAAAASVAAAVTPQQTSPKQASSPIKAVAFADDVLPEAPASVRHGSQSSGAAAAVAAALAEAKLPPAGSEGFACNDISVSKQQQQQQMQALGLLSDGLGYAPQASSWQSAFAANAGVSGYNAAAAAAVEGEESALVCLAAEEDVPTSLWLPEFTRLSASRPTSAVHRPAAALAAAAKARPGSAAAAVGGGLYGRVNGRAPGGVLGAAGRSSVVLSAGVGGGVLMGGKVAGDRGGAGGLGRPKSAGAMRGRKPGNTVQ